MGARSSSRGAFLVIVLLAGVGVAGNAFAASIAYEGFNYAPGSMVQGSFGGGSSGFVGAWAAGGFNANLSNPAVNTNYVIGGGSGRRTSTWSRRLGGVVPLPAPVIAGGILLGSMGLRRRRITAAQG